MGSPPGVAVPDTKRLPTGPGPAGHPLPGRDLTRRESIGAAVARNVVVARLVAGVTQHQLATAADVSRATVAQLETGVCDPRLSTIAELARALGLPPAFLLLGREEVEALVRLAERARAAVAAPIPNEEAERMRAFLSTGLIRDRNRAAEMGAHAARASGVTDPAALVLAAVFSCVLPGDGTAVGAKLGTALQEVVPAGRGGIQG